MAYMSTVARGQSNPGTGLLMDGKCLNLMAETWREQFMERSFSN